MKNKIQDLRNHLFETLEALKDPDNPMDIARARAISEVSQTIIDTAKVEIEFMEASGEVEATEFFDSLKFDEERARRGGFRALTGRVLA
jgi:hypothetical protein